MNPERAADRAAAEAAAERVMAQVRLQQALETRDTAGDRKAVDGIVVASTVLLGAAVGGLAGLRQGHPVAMAALFAVLGGLLGVIGRRVI